MYIGFVWVTINVARCNNFHCTTSSFPLPSTVLEKQRWCYCQTNATNQPSNNEQQELYSPESFGFSQVGTIRGPHGVHGELKIVATSDFAHLRLMKKATRYLLLPNRKYPRPVLLLSGKKASQQNTFIIRLKHITCREQAAELKQAKLFVRSGEAIELEKDEEYLAKSLLSMEALHMHSQLVLGKIVNVYTREEVLSDKKPGAQDILELKRPDGRHVYIPFVRPIVPKIDLERKQIWLDPPEGLMDISFEEKQKPPKIRAYLPAAKNEENK